MSSATPKNKLLDIYVKSLQKDNVFLKGQLAELQKEMKDIQETHIQEKKKQEFEMLELKEDLSTMVKDIANLQTKNTELIEKLEDYESNYVPASGSRKMKDALADARKQLRDVVDKYNNLVDTYDISKQQSASAITEANELRSENTRLQSELTKSRQLYQSSTKELEDNRVDMAKIMKELSELKQAIADGSYEDSNPEPERKQESKQEPKQEPKPDPLILKRLEDAEKKVKELSVHLINITNERDRLLDQQEEGLPTISDNERIRQLEKEVDTADRKVIELTQRCSSFERSVKAFSSRTEVAEKKVKELTALVASLTQERDSLQQQVQSSSKQTSTPDHQYILKKKDEEISKLKSSVIALESEIQGYQQEIESLTNPPPLPDLPPIEHYFLPEELHVEEEEEEEEEDAVASVLQQMIESPGDFSLDTIDDVSFPDCDFTDEHMMLFIRFLRENNIPNLTVIDISHNLLTGASVIPFIQTLLDKQIATLETINLSYNQLDDHFAQALSNLFANATTDCSIKSILFDGNPFSPEVLRQIKCIYGGGR